MNASITITQAKEDYVWRGSQYIALHTIGPYDIVEYWRGPASNESDKRRYREFGTYIDGDKTSHCYGSIDEALAGCIAIRHEGRNTRADGYFLRSMGVDVSQEFEQGAAA